VNARLDLRVGQGLGDLPVQALLGTEPRCDERSARLRSDAARSAAAPVSQGSGRYFGGKDGPRGCFAIGTATTEAVRDPKIRALLAEGFQIIDDAFAARIRFARDHGDLPKGADPAALAMLASATLHTLAIRSRAGASRSTLEAMADATVHLICGPPPGDDHD